MDRTLVISDIDGTLIDHPHFGGASSFQDKALLCRRLISMVRKHRICLCSGRGRSHYVSLQRYYANDPAFPWYFIAESGGHVMRDGVTIIEKEQDRALVELEGHLRRWAWQRSLPIDDDEGESGVEGICFELKRQSLDIEWDTGDPDLNETLLPDLLACVTAMEGSASLRIAPSPGVRRITVCPAEFQPKVSIWPEMKKLLGSPETIWVVGDEQIDRDMAGAIRAWWPESVVRFASANPEIGGDVRLSCGIEAIEFIEGVLNGKE